MAGSGSRCSFVRLMMNSSLPSAGVNTVLPSAVRLLTISAVRSVPSSMLKVRSIASFPIVRESASALTLTSPYTASYAWIVDEDTGSRLTVASAAAIRILLSFVIIAFPPFSSWHRCVAIMICFLCCTSPRFPASHPCTHVCDPHGMNGQLTDLIHSIKKKKYHYLVIYHTILPFVPRNHTAEKTLSFRIYLVFLFSHKEKKM